MTLVGLLRYLNAMQLFLLSDVFFFWWTIFFLRFLGQADEVGTNMHYGVDGHP